MVDEILSFWFGEQRDTAAVSKEKSPLWWQKHAETDREIRDRFGPAHERAMRGEHDDWTETPRGALALVILLDQFSRHLYRDDPRAFASDAKAREVVHGALERGDAEKLRPIERVFLFMPLVHSENRSDQARSVDLFESLVERASADERALLETNLHYAKAHRDIVARFGRFPHRNAVLGRTSTAEEIDFLRQPNSSF